MKTLRCVAVRPTLSPRQNGIVLFIALIALLVISLTAVALIRTVDTATAIAGNLAFKQAATSAGEGAAIEANSWLVAQAAIVPVAPANGPLDSNDLTRGYYAALSTSNTTPNVLRYATTDNLMAPTTWGTANSRAFNDWSTNDNSGNQIRYIIERMCRRTGPPEADTVLNPGQGCVVGPEEDNGDDKGACTGNCPEPTKLVQPVYRITARVQGPRDTMSYIQTFVY